MERRRFIELNTWLLGFSVLAGGGLVSTVSCARKTDVTEGALLGPDDADFLNELAETIIPTTDSPGGREADVGSYIVLIHNDCLSEEEQEENVAFLKSLRSFYQKEIGKDFMESSIEERNSATELIELGREEFYKRYKRLIVSAYMSSKIGASVFMKFNLVPGRYDGCTTERAW